MTLTIEKLMVAAQLVRDFECKTGSPLVPVPFHGLEVICDPNALAATAERNFSPSKNRSKRVLKKLIKRYGSEFKMVPAIFNMQGRIIAHPDRYAELRAMFKEAPR